MAPSNTVSSPINPLPFMTGLETLLVNAPVPIHHQPPLLFTWRVMGTGTTMLVVIFTWSTSCSSRRFRWRTICHSVWIDSLIGTGYCDNCPRHAQFHANFLNPKRPFYSYAPTIPLSLTCSQPIHDPMLPFAHKYLQREQQETWHDIKVKIPWQARLQSNLVILELRSVYLSKGLP